jgi:hypothetical protein
MGETRAIDTRSPLAGAAALHGLRIEQLSGAKGKLDDKEGVFKLSVLRPDLEAPREPTFVTDL